LTAIAESGVYRQLVEAGVRMLEPVCGPCVGMGQAPPTGANSLRTMNRNFPGRSGTPDDCVYLCSPAVAAASMLAGKIADPRELGDPPELLPEPELKPYVDDVHIFKPADEKDAEKIEIPRGPNIKTPPEHEPMPESIAAKVATVQPDDISTGDLAPDGVEVMSYRSNIPAIAEFTFRHRDPEFRKRIREWGSGFIVGGDNYGQGSSREHAALAPLQLGVKAVFAKSFARIHRRNLVAQGILALTFVDPQDYESAEPGQTWRLRAATMDTDHTRPGPSGRGLACRRRACRRGDAGWADHRDANVERQEDRPGLARRGPRDADGPGGDRSLVSDRLRADRARRAATG